MPKLKLTDVAVRHIKPPPKGQVEYWDTTVAGFGVRVSQAGSKSFFVLINRRRKSLGRYPVVSLKDAREEGRRILLDKAGYLRQQEQLEVPYLEAIELYLKKKESEVAARTHENYVRFLRSFDFPSVVRDIRPYQVEDALDRIVGNTNRYHAYTTLKTFFTWCVSVEYCNNNPMQGLKKPKLPSSRDRVHEDWELAAIWEASHQLGNFGAIVRLLMLTGQRKNQIARLEEKWVKKDGITFPAEVMKNRKKHWCPVGHWVRYELLNLMAVDGFYFSPVTAVGKPFSNWSKSKKKLDELIEAKQPGFDHWSLHDLRRTWSTNAARLGIAPHITARVLSHTAEENKVWQIYNRHQYREEMAAAMEKMEEHILTEVRQDTTS